ncbi:MAG: hypothetical protein IPO83_16375 [Chitinophagaceae bacterium]|nr:hypothetical protein [Chitinophagaceae bacterium]
MKFKRSNNLSTETFPSHLMRQRLIISFDNMHTLQPLTVSHWLPFYISISNFLRQRAYAGAILLAVIFMTTSAKGQRNSGNMQLLMNYEDSLKQINDVILDGSEQGIRQNACYDFIKKLVEALKVEGSFDYPFDSLTRISILTPEDKSFRIFNWQLPLTSGKQRFFGAIQMRNGKELKLFPLYDYSDYILHPADTITDNEKWFGALYYRIMEVKGNGKKYYMLFGWDGNNMTSNKKILEVLSFSKQKEPVFGAAIFNFGKESDRNAIMRFILEYKKDAQVSLNYDADLQMITFDHLIPQDASTKDLPYTYVPDGSYEAFQWKHGKWNYFDNVFTSTMTEVPFPNPVDFGKDKYKRK